MPSLPRTPLPCGVNHSAAATATTSARTVSVFFMECVLALAGRGATVGCDDAELAENASALWREPQCRGDGDDECQNRQRLLHGMCPRVSRTRCHSRLRRCRACRERLCPVA